ncbi:MAG: hypothetical protein PF541_00270, partial [Prolixibacteraceae bacterium]|nr:hypothetical protein [Prolixibacteraceae bacterium]
MQYPIFIAKYIEKNKVDSTDLSYLITSTDGIIVNIGSSAECLIASPVVGNYLSNYMPVFEGVFPVKEDVYLPNVQLSHSLFFNIHIVVYSDQIWILCQNITENIHKIRRLIEKKKEVKKYEFSLLEALGFYVFKNNKVGGYRPISGAPKWVNKITNNLEERIDIEILFPYLAFFVEQLPKGIIRKGTIDHYSGIWTQNTLNDSEIHLNAWLYQVLDDSFILVQPVNENKKKENKIIQSARENTLAYEQLQKTKKELQDLLKLKDQFVSIVSHDFRSPISSLTNGISFLLEDINQSKIFDDSHREIIIQIKQE